MILSNLHESSGKYKLLYADPPWKQSRGGKKAVRPKSSGIEFEYPVLSMDDIREHLRIASEEVDNQILFLWTIDKYLFQAQELAESLGFKLHARMVWDKVTGIPAAFTVRFGHEYLLYMYKGKLIPVAKEARGKIHTVFRERPVRHSQKPLIAYEIVEQLYPHLTKLEMYARNEREGFDCWGNEMQK